MVAERIDPMDRREFLFQSGACAAALALPLRGVAQATAANLTLANDAEAVQIPPSYTGLSYEMAQLTDPTFFSAANRDLVAFFRMLSPQGVLRIGGNSSEFCWLRLDASTPEPKLHLPPGDLSSNWMPHHLFAIDPKAIEELAGFMKATGWRLIFGLNFGNSSPQRASAEAALVVPTIGESLDFLQIGNEPDLYHDASNGTRPPGWGFPDYVKEWTAYAEAILEKTPNVRFGGPDVGASSDWVTRFGGDVPASIGPRLVALTGHYYAEGPPNDPRMTTARLLAGNTKIPGEMQRIMAAARAEDRIYRMTEGNSCYRGGKPGMSDAFASALWAGDYMLQLATLGCAGVNLHGGVSQFLTASLGDHTPGMDVAKTPQQRHGGFYTPISSEPGAPVKAMPILYGMMLANQFAGCTPLKVEGMPEGVNATAYAARDAHGCKLAIFNKDERQSLDLAIRISDLAVQVPGNARSATAWRLRGPALDATEGVTLAGAEAQDHGQWSPSSVERLEVKQGAAHIHVPAASAALLFLS